MALVLIVSDNILSLSNSRFNIFIKLTFTWDTVSDFYFRNLLVYLYYVIDEYFETTLVFNKDFLSRFTIKVRISKNTSWRFINDAWLIGVLTICPYNSWSFQLSRVWLYCWNIRTISYITKLRNIFQRRTASFCNKLLFPLVIVSRIVNTTSNFSFLQIKILR